MPALKLHATGVWFCYWGRKSHYFTRDEAASRTLYLEHLRDVYLPAQQAEVLRRTTAAAGRPAARGTLIVDLAHAWLEHQADQRLSPATIDSNRLRLGVLLHTLGTMPAQRFDARILNGMRTDMISAGVHPTVVRHRIAAIKTLFRWAAQAGHVRDVDLSTVPIGRHQRPVRTLYTVAQVRQLIDRAADETARRPLRSAGRPGRIAAQLRAWMSVQYLACLRPSEVHRLARREGVWLLPPSVDSGGGVFALNENKTAWASGAPRYVVLSPEALTHFEVLQPQWSSRYGYHSAVHRALGPCGLPHLLRHCAATHLDEAGAREEDIARCLGHGTPGELRRYMRTARQRLLPTARLLSLVSAAEVSSCPCPAPAQDPDQPAGPT